MERKPHHKFPLGRVVLSREAARTLDRADIDYALDRHASGDYAEWIEVPDSEYPGRLISNVFHASSDEFFEVITEADRSVTTVTIFATDKD